MGQYISVTDTAHLSIRVLLCILKGVLLSLGILQWLVTKASFLRNRASYFALGIFCISEINRIKDNTVSIQYISLTQNLTEKKSQLTFS